MACELFITTIWPDDPDMTDQATVIIDAGDTHLELNIDAADTRLGEDTVTVVIGQPTGPVRIERAVETVKVDPKLLGNSIKGYPVLEES